jgi:cation diffusion facilitator family transporter
VVDPSIASTTRGLWALKWSFIGLMITALLQVVVVVMSDSVALLADTIHNFADAATAIPLGIAFLLIRRGATRRFTYGLGRVEDLAGLVIVITIAVSAVVAFYQAGQRFLHPQPVGFLWAVMLASVVGFIGNETVAIFRIRWAGRSAASRWSPTATTRAWTAGRAWRCSSAPLGSGPATRWPIPSSGC